MSSNSGNQRQIYVISPLSSVILGVILVTSLNLFLYLQNSWHNFIVCFKGMLFGLNEKKKL